jgi:glucose-6-phosphate 1-dehydrogenase
MTVSLSDTLVLFGVTGDLAHKMIFPGAALHRPPIFLPAG